MADNGKQSGCLIDKLAIAGMRQSGGDAKQHVERRFHVTASIPAKDELFEVAAQVRRADAVIGAERPSLEIGEDAMDPRQDHMRRHLADDLGLVVVALEAFVYGEAVAEDGSAFFNSAGDEAFDAGRREVLQRRETDAARMAIGREFDRADEMQLADGAAALAAGYRVVFGAVGDVALVDFDEILEKRSIGIDHGAP